jgi:hypothetical protein
VFGTRRQRLLQTVRKVVTRGEKKQEKKRADRNFSRRNPQIRRIQHFSVKSKGSKVRKRCRLPYNPLDKFRWEKYSYPAPAQLRIWTLKDAAPKPGF